MNYDAKTLTLAEVKARLQERRQHYESWIKDAGCSMERTEAALDEVLHALALISCVEEPKHV